MQRVHGTSDEGSDLMRKLTQIEKEFAVNKEEHGLIDIKSRQSSKQLNSALLSKGYTANRVVEPYNQEKRDETMITESSNYRTENALNLSQHRMLDAEPLNSTGFIQNKHSKGRPKLKRKISKFTVDSILQHRKGTVEVEGITEVLDDSGVQDTEHAINYDSTAIKKLTKEVLFSEMVINNQRTKRIGIKYGELKDHEVEISFAVESQNKEQILAIQTRLNDKNQGEEG